MILPTDRYDLENVTYFTNSQFVTYLHFSVSNFLGQSPTYFMSHEGNMFFFVGYQKYIPDIDEEYKKYVAFFSMDHNCWFRKKQSVVGMTDFTKLAPKIKLKNWQKGHGE